MAVLAVAARAQQRVTSCDGQPDQVLCQRSECLVGLCFGGACLTNSAAADGDNCTAGSAPGTCQDSTCVAATTTTTTTTTTTSSTSTIKATSTTTAPPTSGVCCSPPRPGKTGTNVALIGGLGALVALLVIVLGVVLYKRRRGAASLTTEVYDMPVTASHVHNASADTLGVLMARESRRRLVAQRPSGDHDDAFEEAGPDDDEDPDMATQREMALYFRLTSAPAQDDTIT